MSAALRQLIIARTVAVSATPYAPRIAAPATIASSSAAASASTTSTSTVEVATPAQFSAHPANTASSPHNNVGQRRSFHPATNATPGGGRRALSVHGGSRAAFVINRNAGLNKKRASACASYGEARRWRSSASLGLSLVGGGVGGTGTGATRSMSESAPLPTRVDAVVVGAGQAGLSVAYHLQKAGGLRYVTLDANQEPGGAWRHRWPSLELFSTRKWSSLPGYPMFANGACEDGYPTTREMAMYMEEYEEVMKLNIVRPVTVTGVTRTTMGTFLVETDCLLGGAPARWECRAVISAAGTHAAPVWPRLPGAENFRGVQIHSSQYRHAEDFRGARVAVVGGGNSGAQILAEVSQPGMAASTLWSTEKEPSFLPKRLSGKEVFDTVARLRQKQGYVRSEDIPSLTSIIMQPSVLEASDRGVYDQRIPAFTRFTPTGVAWNAEVDPTNGGESFPAGEAEVDAVIWCTGYNANTSHLARLGMVKPDSTVTMDGGDMGATADEPGVFAVGYGNWAGVGSGSIPGATMYAKRAASAAIHHLRGESAHSTTATNMARAAVAMFPLGNGGGGRVSSWPSAGRATAVAVAGAASSATEVGVGGGAIGGSREDQEPAMVSVAA